MKNKKIMLTALLLSAVLITSCFMATTVSYYKSDYGSTTASAKIAKWGIGQAASVTFNPFKQSYTNGSLTVAASSNNNIIAPGLTGSSSVTFAAPTTAPEVSYRFLYTVTAAIDSAIVQSSGLVLKVNGTNVNLNGSLSDMDAGSSAIFAAGEKPSSLATVTVEWSWPQGGDASVANDTALGLLTTGNGIEITVKATAVQVFAEEGWF